MKWLKRRRRARTMRNIRQGLAALGHDPSRWSDEEIERAAIAFGRIGAEAGITTEEMARRLTAAARLPSIRDPYKPEWAERLDG